MARTKGWSTLGRVASCVIVVAERTSFVSRSLRAMLGVLKIVAYSAGDSPPAWVMSAVCALLGGVLRSDQVLPPSSVTWIGAVVLAGPPGFGVKAEAARMLGLDANVVRKGSASCHVSPLSDAGIMSTTRTPGGGGGGGEGAPSGGFGGRWQAATTQATAARRVVARMATGYTGGGPRVAKSTLKSGPGEA